MIIQGVSRWFGVIAGAAMVLAALHVTIDVILRFTGSPVLGTLEYTSYVWMPIIVFLALSGAYVAGEHLRATVLVDALHGRWKLFLEITASVLFFLIAAVIAVFLWHQGIEAMQIGEASSTSGPTVVIWPTRLIAALGMTLLAVQIASSLVSSLVRKPETETEMDHDAID